MKVAEKVVKLSMDTKMVKLFVDSDAFEVEKTVKAPHFR